MINPLLIVNCHIGWPDFDFFIPGHWFSKAQRAAAWGPKGRKWDGVLGRGETRLPNDFLYFYRAACNADTV